MGNTLRRYRGLFEGLKKKEIHRLYFLYGPEEYLKKEFIGELLRSVLPDTNRAFNLDVLYGDEFDQNVFDDRVGSFPLFASTRVVVLRNFKALTNPQKDFVIEAASRVPDSLVLVVETPNDKLDTARLRHMHKTAEKNGLAFNFEFLDEAETVERVAGRFKKEGYRIHPEALDLLVESVGPNLTDLINEVDKIFLAAGGDKTVDVDLVRAVVGKYRVESTFSLLDEVGNRDPAAILRKLASVLDGGEEPVLVLAMLLKRTVLLLEVEALLVEKGKAVSSGRDLAAAMSGSVNPFYAGRLLRQVSHCDRTGLEILLSNLRWADLKLKTTQLRPKGVLEEALLASYLRKILAYPARSI